MWVNLVSDRGGWTDPPGKSGLASMTMDMLNEGAGGQSAEDLAKAGRRLGSSLGTWAGLDGAGISLRSLRRNLGPSLDLMQTVLATPDFPQADLDLMRKKRIQDLKAERDDPNDIAARVFARLTYGDAYAGRLTQEADYQAISTDDLRAWYGANLSPATSLLLVGGDTTMAEVLPLLESRFGGWTAAESAPPLARPTLASVPQQGPPVVYLVDKPGAAQSVLRIGAFVGEETDPDWPAFNLANLAVGGQFTARINMNLREDKGITYGARTSVAHNYLPGLWYASTSVVTPETATGVVEILRELREARAERPITAEELDNARGGLIGTWPLNFESPGYLLDQTADILRYKLPETWLTDFMPTYQAVTVAQANAAFQARVDPDQLVILVVGDAAVIGPSLQERLGLPIVMLNADGAPLAP